MKLDPNKIKGASSFYKEIGPYLGLGLQLAVTVTIMVFVGVWLDGKFNTNPILTIIFAFLGVFAGLYTFIKSVLKAGNDKK
jgi:ATP synthase protein I